MKKIILSAVLSIFTMISFAQIQKETSVSTQTIAIEKRSISSLNTFNFHGDDIWLFTDKNYQGKKKILKTIGNTELSFDLASLGEEWNDVISSCLVPNGVKIIFYENEQFNKNVKGAWVEIIGRGTEYYARTTHSYVSNKGTMTPKGPIGVYIDNNDFSNMPNANYKNDVDNIIILKGVQSDCQDLNSGKVIDFNDKASSIRIVRYSN